MRASRQSTARAPEPDAGVWIATQVRLAPCMMSAVSVGAGLRSESNDRMMVETKRKQV